MYSKKEKKDDELNGNPFGKVVKTTTLQDARCFNELPVNARKCVTVLSKLLYLLNQGEQFSTQEATDAFFNITKLFQSKDNLLRRLVYLCIKELSQIAENVYVVTSSLTTDMNAKDDLHRPQALRALCHITDASTFQGIERFMKQAIVDKNPHVASAALVSALHLTKLVPDCIRRWVNEASASLKSENSMVQYHSLGVLYNIRKNDKQALSKLVKQCIDQRLKSPYGLCMLIRIAVSLIKNDPNGNESPYYRFIESCLREKYEMVVYEAANAIVNLDCTTSRELTSAISLLQIFLSSSKPVVRFAAVRTFNRIAMTKPLALSFYTVDFENLITDSNRSIATLAITILLKIGTENTVERLLKLISTFINEISDEFKIIVVESTRQLCQKFPNKYSVTMNCLKLMLREDGGFEYKKAIVDTFINIMEDNPDAKEKGFYHLCDFIEDCEHHQLAIKILNLLGKEGPRTKQPSQYIRYIYNRLILERVDVRAAAVSALAKFGAQCEELLPNILILLNRSALDSEDEVRDRATFFYDILQMNDRNMNNMYILNPLQVSLVGLEKALVHYVNDVDDTPFDIRTVPREVIITNNDDNRQPLINGMLNNHNVNQRTNNAPTVRNADRIAATRQDIFFEQLNSIQALRMINMGPLLKSSLPIDLTESETEYVVQCIKHTFAKYIVFQFDCKNTMNDQILENVYVSMTIPDGYTKICDVPCPQLVCDVIGPVYVCVEFNDLDMAAEFQDVLLKYTVKDCDPVTGIVESDEEGYKDEYALENIEIQLGDFMQPIVKTGFTAIWDELGGINEAKASYALNNKTMEEAIREVSNFMGMKICEGSDRVESGSRSHVLKMSGLYLSDYEVLSMAKFLISDQGVITMALFVRCIEPSVAEIIAQAIE